MWYLTAHVMSSSMSAQLHIVIQFVQSHVLLNILRKVLSVTLGSRLSQELVVIKYFDLICKSIEQI
jgi:hypothetical protein